MEVRVTPQGKLRWVVEIRKRGSSSGSLIQESSVEIEGLAGELNAAFLESSVVGLVALQKTMSSEMSASAIYWRGFGDSFFHSLCHGSESLPSQWRKLVPPSDLELEQLVAAAPPMQGLEYVTIEMLKSLWSELAELAAVQASDAETPGDYLRSVNPQLNLLGRVTFHLAENKSDTEHPFAFMATYTNRVSRNSKLQHLPLGQAVKQYAGARNKTVLQSLLAPISRAAERDPLARELLDSKAIFHPQAWTIKQAHRLLKAGDVLEECGLVLRLPDWWKKGRSKRVAVRVEVGNKQPSHVGTDSLLSFSANLALDGQALTAAEAKQLLAADASLAMLRGQWVEVDKKKLVETLEHWEAVADTHPDGISFLSGMRLIAGVEVDPEDEELESDREWQFVSAGKWLKDKLETLRDPSRADYKPGKDLNATLRPYQEAGVQWLSFLQQLGTGGCLADDMGLGKTIQVIALLLMIKKRARKSVAAVPSLLVVPASLVGNWRQEIEKFAPSLDVFYAHPSESGKEELSRFESEAAFGNDVDLVITTYGLARRWKWLADRQWNLLVLDEAQAIKNSGSAQTRAIKKLRSHTNFALTGTPVENHLGDLWSLFDFCCPGLLGSASQFKKYVKRLQGSEAAQPYAPLRALIRPYILRRLKSDPEIAPDLPSKTEMRCECALSKKQVALYQDVVNQLKDRLKSDKVEGIARRGLVLSSLMQFKQICNHPSQFLGKEDFSVKESGKLLRLAEICQSIRARQEKLLLFTQFRGITDPLADFLADEFSVAGLVLHGGTSVKRRKQLVAEFQQDEGPPFFVISLKAGGVGLNLTAASHVIHFDRWWNPAVENQATDRAFRIGQKKNVLVHKFVCRGTVEENIDRMIADKTQLSEEVLGNDPDASGKAITEMDDDQLIDLVSLDLNRAVG